jgi:type IV secretion system protein VirD4
MKARNVVLGNFGVPRASRIERGDWIAVITGAGAVALFASWLLTAWFAAQAGYPAALGTPWTKLGTIPVHPPWKWLVWRSLLAARAPNHPLVTASHDLGWLIPLLAGTIGLLMLRARTARRSNRREELHGSSHWATPDEVDETKLLGQTTGVICGMWFDPRSNTDRYLRHRGVEHVLTVAPTRSGKDKGVVTPTVLTHDGSMIITDPKGETWEETAGYLHSKGVRVIRFEPSAEPGSTARFNPLAEIRLGTHRERADALDLATSWLDEDGKSFQGEGGIWPKAARPLITAAILHVLYREKLLEHPTAHLGHVFYEFNPPARTFQEVLDEWATFPHDPTYAKKWKLSDGTPTRTHPVVASVAMSLLGLAPETLASILLSAQAALSVLYDDCVEQNLATSDFRLDHIANGAQPMALYLVYPPDVVERLAPVFRTMIELIFHRLSERLDFSSGRARSPHAHRVLAALNEFPAFGRMRAVEAALPICAGYGITALIMVQDLQQLRATYGGADESITAQCRIRIIYAPNRYETAELISKMLGTVTALKTAESESGGGGGAGYSRANVSHHEVGRSLMLPDELLLRMPGPVRDAADQNVLAPGNLIVLKTGHPPVYAKQVFFWLDPELKRRAAIRAPAAGRRAQTTSNPSAQTAQQLPVPSRSQPTATAPASSGEGRTLPHAGELTGHSANVDNIPGGTDESGRTAAQNQEEHLPDAPQLDDAVALSAEPHGEGAQAVDTIACATAAAGCAADCPGEEHPPETPQVDASLHSSAVSASAAEQVPEGSHVDLDDDERAIARAAADLDRLMRSL